MSSEVLWLAREDARYFLVPEGHALPDGPTLVEREDVAEARSTDLERLVEFEVSRKAATDWLRRARHAAPDDPAPGLALLAALTGTDGAALKEDPAALRDAVGALFARGRDVLSGAASADEARVRDAAENAKAATRTLRDAGLPVGDLETLVHRLNELVQDPEAKAERARMADRLRKIGDKMRDLAKQADHAARRVDREG